MWLRKEDKFIILEKDNEEIHWKLQKREHEFYILEEKCEEVYKR